MFLRSSEILQYTTQDEDGIDFNPARHRFAWAFALAEVLQHEGQDVRGRDLIQRFRGIPKAPWPVPHTLQQIVKRVGLNDAYIAGLSFKKETLTKYLDASSRGLLVLAKPFYRGISGHPMVISKVTKDGQFIMMDPSRTVFPNGTAKLSVRNVNEILAGVFVQRDLLAKVSPIYKRD